jgi:hypothetical protein
MLIYIQYELFLLGVITHKYKCAQYKSFSFSCDSIRYIYTCLE